MRLNQEGESVVVVPSVTVDQVNQSSGSLTQAYEERFLFLLLLLRQPRLRMVYVTSTPIAPQIVSTTWPCCPASSPATPGPGCPWSRSRTGRRGRSPSSWSGPGWSSRSVR